MERSTKEGIIAEVLKTHPDAEFLDFSKMIYVESSVKFEVIDHGMRPDGSGEYGSFWITKSNLRSGKGHPDRAIAKRVAARKVNEEKRLAETGTRYTEKSLEGFKKISSGHRDSFDEFVKKVKETHVDAQFLDFSNSVYNGERELITVVDHGIDKNGNEYGAFTTPAYNLKQNYRHPKRKGVTNYTEGEYYKRGKNNLDTFIEGIKEKNPYFDVLDFSNSVYKDVKTKIEVIDHAMKPDGSGEYGVFYATVESLTNGAAHPDHMFDVKVKNLIDNVMSTHVDAKWLDFSKMVYVNNKTKIEVIDHEMRPDGSGEYGSFWIIPTNLQKGQGHPDKKGLKIARTQMGDWNEIRKKLEEVHKDEMMDYSQAEYKGMHENIKIICHLKREDGTEYGEFWQEVNAHLHGSTHPELGKIRQIEKQKLGTEEFIKRAKIVHANDDYDYSLVEYGNNQTERVKIICNKIGADGKPHGLFYALAGNFIYHGHGCPRCAANSSKNEDEIGRYIESLIGEENVMRHNRSVLANKLELDIYVPSKKLAVEYNGLYWHSEKSGGKDKNYHLNKLEDCQKMGIKLIHIFEDEYIDHKDIVLNKIKHLLGITDELPKIFGEDCIYKEINDYEAEEFLNKYYIQGFTNSDIYLGAYHNNELMTVISLKKSEKDRCYEITRFASNYNYTCKGVYHKLIAYFITNYQPIEIKAFADRRWAINEENNIYLNLGFQFDGYTEPTYKVYDKFDHRYQRLDKSIIDKERLNEENGITSDMTDEEAADQLGLDRIYDCGLIRYVWTAD